MSVKPSQRGGSSGGTTLGDVIVAIEHADLPDRRRQELNSAVRTAARALGRRAEELPAEPRLLANRLAEVAPIAIGLSRGRWANVRSLLRTAMSQVQEMSPAVIEHPYPRRGNSCGAVFPLGSKRCAYRGLCALRALTASNRNTLLPRRSRDSGSILTQHS